MELDLKENGPSFEGSDVDDGGNCNFGSRRITLLSVVDDEGDDDDVGDTDGAVENNFLSVEFSSLSSSEIQLK